MGIVPLYDVVSDCHWRKLVKVLYNSTNSNRIESSGIKIIRQNGDPTLSDLDTYIPHKRSPSLMTDRSQVNKPTTNRNRGKTTHE